MIYRFEHKNYKTFEIFGDNKMEPRAYFIPFSSRSACDETDYIGERYASKRVTLLNGNWQFGYYRNICDVPREFDTDKIPFDDVEVPSMWQYTGFEEPFYVNQRYEFPAAPPRIPTEEPVTASGLIKFETKEKVTLRNSIGIYRKKFVINKTDKKRFMTFLGVCSNIELYINGKYVGYSEGSHNSAEFDITPYLVEGENELVALVYKWCNGTYLECQDMFRSNGIFRDVYITECEDAYVWDYEVDTEYIEESKYKFRITADIRGDLAGKKLRLTLADGKKDIYVQEIDASSKERIEAPLHDVKEWSADKPDLYTLYIEIVKNGRCIECIRQEVGFKHIEIKGDKRNKVFYLNNAKVKLLGVNHHDTTMDKGYYMTPEEMVRDVELMKEYNVNAVRTSHYPPDPLFVKLANHYGLYVIDEADIETHGCCVPLYREHLISNNLAWKEHYLDRVKRMYFRDRNCVSVTMWSLGNEAGGYRCQDYCYDYLKNVARVRIPVHYEGVSRTKRWAYDVVSQMYASTEFLEKIAAGKAPKKFYNAPYFLCEYAHAMGVGPGSIDMYVKLFLSSDNLLGGCVWEWADHAVLHSDTDKRYRYKYTYGGDHGEYEHDGNFCVDGMFFPDRTPSSGALEMKDCYRLLRAIRVGDGQYKFSNRYCFTNASEFDIEWSYRENGVETQSGTLKVDIPPCSERVVKIEHGAIDKNSDICIVFSYKRGGREVAKEQILLNKYLPRLPQLQSSVKDMHIINIAETERMGVSFPRGIVVFNKRDGFLESYTVDGVEYVSQKPSNNMKSRGLIGTVYRAPIDNYRNIVGKWIKQGLDKTYLKMVDMSGVPVEEDGHYKIEIVYDILGVKNKMQFIYVYRVYSCGTVDVDVTLTNKGKPVDMPKIGTTFEMPREFVKTRFYGMGNVENYSDFSSHAVLGIYEKGVDEYEEEYIKPQDSGNMSEVRWAEVYNENGEGLKFIANNVPFNFKTSRYTMDAMKAALHREDLKQADSVCVCVDGFVRGLGSNSCGPDARAEYRYILKKAYSYSFRMQPVKM